MSTFKLDFGAGFDITEDPADEFNVELDLSEIAAGGELGGQMDAPTVDATHAGSAHHAEAHTLASHSTKAHSELTGVGANDHHAQAHGLADHAAGSARISVGTDAAKPAAGTADRLYFATDTGVLYRDTGAAWVEMARSETFIRLAQLSEKLHASLTSVTADQHHAENHAARHQAGGADIVATARLRSGTDAAKPGSGNTEGDVYWATDTDRLYIWDGAAWKEIGAGGGSVQAPWAIWVPNPIFIMGSAIWPTTNRAIFAPFTVLTSVTVTGVRINVAVQSGNLDVGIYNESRSRLVSSGSVAVGATGGQLIDIADTALAAGRYYFAMAVNNVTASFTRDVSMSSVLGRWQYEDSAFPLPASVAAFDGFYNYCPIACLHISGGIG